MTDFTVTDSEVTEAVQRILGEVLGIDNADLTQSFHRLGGDSLRALKAAGRIAFEFKAAAAVDGTILEALLDGTTGEALARILLDSIEQEAAEEFEDPQATELSFGEERLWTAHQYQQDRSTYHSVGAFRVMGTLDLTALDRAVEALVDRHPALRTRYAPDHPAVERGGPGRPSVDVVHHREVIPWSEAEGAAERGIQEPFDLTSGRLLRVRTWRTGEREWLLQVILHHIAIDGWSMDIFYRELAALYAGDDPGPGESVDYRDFAQWQRSSTEVEVQAEAWAARLLPLPDRIELGNGRRRRPTRSLEGQVLYTDLPPEIGDKLARLAEESRTSLFVVLLALLHVCLAQRTRQWDALIGTVVAGRSRPQDHATVGYFTNTVPVRAKTSPDATFGELIASLREEWRYVFTHQGVPLEELAVRTRRAPDPARTPLVDVVMVLQNNDDVPLMLADCVAEPLWMHTGTAKFDLMLEAIRVSGILHLSWEYATEVLTADEVAELASAFEHLARALPEDGDTTLRDLLRPARAELVEVDAADVPGSPDVDLCGRFETVVGSRPDDVALYGPAAEVTFRELGGLRDRVTGCLVTSGVTRGDVVAVDVPDPALSVAAMLATWSVGAVVVMIDAGWSGWQRDQLMRACRPAVLIGGRETNPQGPVVVSAGEVAAASPYIGAPVRCRPDEPARLVVDFGATGVPEIVVGSHRGLLDRCLWAWDTVPYEPGDRAVVHALPSPVDAIAETLAPLLAGVPLAVLPATAASDAHTTAEWVRRYRGTRLLVTPSLMWTMLHSVPEVSEALTTLRMCVFTGEELDADLVGRVREALPECRLVNLYGSSDTTGYVTCAEVTTLPVGADVPIGRPVAGTRVFIVDEWGEPVPDGVVGELVVAGAAVGMGYLTDGKVVRTGPFRTGVLSDGDLPCCHTGDLGYRDRDGQLMFAGRGDREVRVRGFRVELAHVESTLRGIDGVSGAVAWTEHALSGDRILAAVVPQPGAELPGDEVRMRLQYRLPSYMVPARVNVIDTLPLTAHGTLDHGAIAASVTTRRDDGPAASGEASAAEKRIRSIWSQVLQGESPGPDDNFFALGGDSLAVTAMLTSVLREFGIELGVVRFLMRPTIRGIVDQLVERGAVA
ncbi:condensation domain-containing protein [Pseudonocardia xinjiangensis]|uniref:non-ribosomal peptide synthetase n=1 Tax=Pseudonocardia xinjiangensis TaxID=75289 RepID=UPI003D8B3CF4